MEPRHGSRYEEILALALAVEKAGFDAFFRSDHLFGVDPEDRTFRPTDCWTTIGGLARAHGGGGPPRLGGGLLAPGTQRARARAARPVRPRLGGDRPRPGRAAPRGGDPGRVRVDEGGGGTARADHRLGVHPGERA